MNNKVQLIAYINRLVEGGLPELLEVLNTEFKDLFGGIHILPFYFPIDGSDAGFDPIDHASVDPRLGTWADLAMIGQRWDVMADLIVNHMSTESEPFKDYLKHGEKSEYKELFLTKSSVFKEADPEEMIDLIYRPRPGEPFTTYSFDDGTKVDFWTTFTAQQVDINVNHPIGKKYLNSILSKMHQSEVRMIRLDAAGYAIKKPGTSCFMIPETYDFISELSSQASKLNMKVLVEIHSYYQDQIEIAKKVDFVYDFALPPLVLHALFAQKGDYLYQWLSVSPKNCITVLDTHDGIGIIDVGPSKINPDRKGLLPESEIAFLIEKMHANTDGQSEKATGKGANNLDIYQINSTYYDVLGKDDDLYILARTIQFFSPGIPQVYYMGLLGETNDVELFENTGVGRDMNRHYFNRGEIKKALERPVTKRLIELIKFRNAHYAFNGSFAILNDQAGLLQLIWTSEYDRAALCIDFSDMSFVVKTASRQSAKDLFTDVEKITF